MKELIDIGKRLLTQDNRCTMDPMFCLQIKVRDVGYDPQYSDGTTVWIDMESGDYQEVEPETEGAEEFGFKDRWETIMVAFTEEGLNDYMRQDGHNVKRRAHNGETRIYVESFRRCDEMIRIREALLAMAKEDDAIARTPKQARDWFLCNSTGSLKCVCSAGHELLCASYSDAERFFAHHSKEAV